MKRQIRYKNFEPHKLTMIRAIAAIVEEYEEQDLRLTVRQLYYVFIGRNLIPDSWIDPVYNKKHNLPHDTKNTKKNYQRFGDFLQDARYAGIVSWSAIEDRVREPIIWQDYESAKAFVEHAARTFRLPRWRRQENYVELWVEKEALAGVLEPVASEYHATLMVNKGYSSASALFESAERFVAACDEGRSPILFYIGDHDPSGEDMVRDIRDRLTEFGVRDLDIRKLALTREQIRRFRPPPNPAKTSDSRARAYIAEHGTRSWEVDAIPPPELQRIIRRAFESVVDREKMDEVIALETKGRETLRRAAARIKDG